MEAGSSEKEVRCGGTPGNPTDLRSRQRRFDAHYAQAAVTPTSPPSFLPRLSREALSATVAAIAATPRVSSGCTYLGKLRLREQC